MIFLILQGANLNVDVPWKYLLEVGNYARHTFFSVFASKFSDSTGR